MGTRPFLILLVMCIYFLNAQVIFEEDLSLSKAIQKMTANIYTEEVKSSAPHNIVISPLSIHLAMSFLYYGSKGNSRRQLKDALGLKSVRKRAHLEKVKDILDKYKYLHDENITLDIANGMYVANDLNVKPEYKNLIKNQFDADIETLNFCEKKNAVDIINTWAANKTNNLITKLVSEESVNTEARMVILNAVYFKAKWLIPFDEKHTRKRNFTIPNKGQRKTDFMFLSENLESAFIEELNATIVALPYTDEDFKMLIVHPEESSNIDDLEIAFFNNPKGMMIEEYLTRLEKKETDLLFPKFETGSDISLVWHFQEMGVTDIFGNEGNFEGISDDIKNQVGDIIHKTKIIVSEEGSEAAAATAVIFTKVFRPNLKISINSPFIFFIFDTNNNIPIFLGKIIDPFDGKPFIESTEAEEQNTRISEEEYPKIVEI